MTTNTGVALPERDTGSRFFHRILKDAVARFPKELAAARLPSDGKRFKRDYGDALVRFEAARLGSAARVEVAQHMARATLAAMRLQEDQKDAPLLEALTQNVDAPAHETQRGAKTAGFIAEVPFEGTTYRGKDVLSLVDRLHADHHMTTAARAALRWIVEHIDAQGGALDLSQHRFALLGASAELSPVRMLLAAGATVLWVDVKPPPSDLPGTIVHAPNGDDLLANPRAVLASIRRFAEDGPVHLGLLAYAPGASRELRIACAMNAIALTLGSRYVRSLAMLISPTSPGELQPEDKEVVLRRRSSSPAWQRALGMARVLPGPGFYGENGNAVSRAIVPLQGPGYQAAQYLAKIATAELFATDGLAGKPVTLSANVAGITNTRSLAHPLFQVAFVGAPSFGVRIFDPPATRALSGLLMLHDLLNPNAPGHASRTFATPTERARAVRSQQIHGGVYDLPWQFDASVRVAAVLGSARRPGLLFNRP